MKRHLNVKNKILIFAFVVIILMIIGILVYSVKKVGYKNSTLYSVTDKNVLFADDFSSIDTKSGGKIEKSWNEKYRYLSSDNVSYSLGDTPVIYDSLADEVIIIGTKYNVHSDGTVVKVDDIFRTTDNTTYFFKLDDRKYLIISKEIYDSNKTIYTKKYLIVDIDKQGNASFLNDAINVKTINPIKLIFDNYIFDVANERLLYKDSIIDLKEIIGSTNQYVEKEKSQVVYEYDSKELVDSYNELVNNFKQYAQNNNYKMFANNQVSGNTTVIINNGGNGNNNNSTDDSSTSTTDDTDNKEDKTENKTELIKKVSLRGVTTTTSYIDVSYIVTDPESKYQAVYLLVTGNIDNELKTQKIVLDKYNNKYRIAGVDYNSEYTISLGYIEIIMNNDEKSFVDNIEDVINVRTKNIEYSLSIVKIAFGRVYFNYKMFSNYAFENADIALLVDDEEKESLPITYNSMISSSGFSSSFDLPKGNVYELRIKNAKYHNRNVNTNIYKKFTLTS